MYLIMQVVDVSGSGCAKNGAMEFRQLHAVTVKKQKLLMNTNYSPITVPPDWNEQKDMTRYQEIYEETGDCLVTLYDRIGDNYSELHCVLKNAIRFFMRNTETAHPLPLAALTIDEKIEWLEELLCAAPRTEQYLARFGDDLSHCRWVEAQRKRLLRSYRPPNGALWLYPLCLLADSLVSSGMRLEESLICEHGDYDQPRVYI